MQKVPVTIRDPNNPRKIPAAIFLENAEEFVKKYTAEASLESLQEIYNKYKMMEMQITKSKQNMLMKIPEIEKALEIINLVEQKQDEEYMLDYMLTDTIWSKAKVLKGTKTVNLWLGANTMVEFSFNEAVALLKKNLENAKDNLKAFEDDIVFLKDQITTTEVNIARVYNYNVKAVQEQNKQKQAGQ